MGNTFTTTKIAFAISLGLFGGGAYAQEVSQHNDTAELEIIEVTAQKRVQNINKTAIAVTSISAEAISKSGNTSFDQVLKGVTGVEVQGLAQGAQIFIRGVGSSVDPGFADPAVATLIDGIYTGRTESVQSGAFDLARMEVLRGPQGTLYGRNASGGSVNIITQNPLLDETEGYVRLQLGNYGLVRTEGALNVAPNEDLALRVSGFKSDRDGYISDGSMDDDSWGLRAKLLFLPADNATLLAKYEVSASSGHGMNTVPVPNSAGNLVFPPFLGSVTESGWVTADNSDAWENDAQHLPGVSERKAETLSLQLDINFGWGDLTLLPAYSKQENMEKTSHLFGILDPDLSCGCTDDYTEGTGNATYKSLETRFTSSVDSSWDWIIGLYYLNSQGDLGGDGQEIDLDDGTYILNQGFAPSTTTAVFAQSTYPINDMFRVTTGLRWSKDSRESNYELFSPEGSLFEEGYDKNVAESITWKAGLEYDLAQNSLLYVHVATGFKQGGVSQTVPVQKYDPEKLTSYEVGLKNRLLGGTLQLNSAIFFYDYKNYQLQSLTSMAAGSTGSYSNFQLISNAGNSQIQGAEATVEWAVSSAGRLTGSLTYLHTEYGAAELPLNPFADGGPYQLKGRQMANSPEWALMLGYEHSWELDDGELIASINSKYSEGYFTTTEYYLPGAWQDSYTRTDATLRYVANDGWSAGLWLKNLENDAQTAYVYPVYRRFVNEPFTFGLNVNYPF